MVDRSKRGVSYTVIAIVIIAAIAIVCVVGALYWNATHYSIGIGQVAVVTDQFGGILRVESGPLGWAEKSIWESVKYYNIAVQTEEMISIITVERLDNFTVNRVNPAPKEGLSYGAISVDTIDVSNVYVDIAVQWHIDINRDGWENRLKILYGNYSDEGYAKKTLFNAVRDYARDYVQILNMTTDDLVFSNRVAYSTTVTSYVQNQTDEKLPTLGGAVIIDQIFVRRVTPPESLQVQYAKVLEARKQAEAILTLANATRDASIQIAEGQSQAITLVIEATESAMTRMQAQGLNATEAAQYLLGQYGWEALKEMAKSHPEITFFFGTPQNLTPVFPVQPNP